MRLAVLLLALAAAAPAAAQSQDAGSAEALLDKAALCAPGLDPVEIGLRAAGRGWIELKRGEALKLQAAPDKKAQIQAWAVPDQPGPPAYLLVEAQATWPPRRVTCELVLPGGDPAVLMAALRGWDFGDGPLGPPRRTGAWGAGGDYAEWAAPPESPWRLVSVVSQPPPRRGPRLTRIRFSGVQN